ncbi:MAG: hypothetical protein GY940_34090, partial [bacterium]|nr:hypothetical protein [bacterium]
QEADTLHHWCEQDKEALTGAGLPWETVEDLPIRNGALIHSEALWNTELKARGEATRKWKQESPLAYQLREELLHAFRYAFRKHRGLLAKVKITRKGKKHTGMIQDLNDLAVMGKHNPGLLEAIGFDMSLLDKAAQTSSEMARLLARVTTEKLAYSNTKRVRDQAYTHLKEAVDEIRECGRFVFWNNKGRLRGYRSHYMHTKYLRTKNLKKELKPLGTGAVDTK